MSPRSESFVRLRRGLDVLNWCIDTYQWATLNNLLWSKGLVIRECSLSYVCTITFSETESVNYFVYFCSYKNVFNRSLTYCKVNTKKIRPRLQVFEDFLTRTLHVRTVKFIWKCGKTMRHVKLKRLRQTIHEGVTFRVAPRVLLFEHSQHADLCYSASFRVVPRVLLPEHSQPRRPLLFCILLPCWPITCVDQQDKMCLCCLFCS